MTAGNMKAELITSVTRQDQFPAEERPEIAFLGRSNVGKSSLLNCLLEQTSLARTSSRPGCTQVINFYRVGGVLHFVDLPGYGYAQTPPRLKRAWKRLIESYLVRRKSLELSLLLLDVRRGWMEMDLELKRWLEFHKRRYLVIATKFDKLRSQRERHRGLAAVREHCTASEPLPFSAVTGQGVREIWQAIRTIKNRA
jgi:GTP-binding protein